MPPLHSHRLFPATNLPAKYPGTAMGPSLSWKVTSDFTPVSNFNADLSGKPIRKSKGKDDKHMVQMKTKKEKKLAVTTMN